ncbi:MULTISPECIES: NADH-quinone oxidoreductase subunit C [unclassified Sphingomonas]|uniref:NADH-quinone oxidoreductase subunit C n=1 Tax=unclassified Sphingomonas TaxID=196159 RepID=UPI00215099B7|nr:MULTISPECIES: NADH-quinone oxidoreductase subunit C [unclassified Sphingomonas]MCR5872691.1 NADH-quinone oxidoreductase subunit C [Sphingomonas sp. J344]UUX99023.1 NADH-quinone oxidoreductase subunit C [Sphingomonas sp. J315]
MKAPAPKYAANDGVIAAAQAALGDMLVEATDLVGEVNLTVDRARLPEAMIALRDGAGLHYQALMEVAGVDYPERAERFDVCYMLLSYTRNHRIRVRVTTDEVQPVPSVTSIWPVAGWLEREVYDMYGVLFEGNSDLRRILTDYGFRGHPQRKDFPLSGFVELRYSEADKRVVYEPVQLAQDFRNFDFMSPWEGAEYILPGDEKYVAPPPPPAPPAPPPAVKVEEKPAAAPAAKGAPTPATADAVAKSDAADKPVKARVRKPKTSDGPQDTGIGKASPGAGPAPANPDVVKKPRKPAKPRAKKGDEA